MKNISYHDHLHIGPKNGSRSLKTLYLKAVKYTTDRAKKREHLQSIVYEIEFLKLESNMTLTRHIETLCKVIEHHLTNDTLLVKNIFMIRASILHTHLI